MRLSDWYQSVLILLGLAACVLFGLFLYREIFPEYKVYQEDFVALEKFRSTYTHQPPPGFQYGVKQILLPKKDNGEPFIDRCITCHVALQIPDYSPTKIARDVNGNILVDDEGRPVQVPNENYVWGRLEGRIADLLNPKALENVRSQGENALADERIAQAEAYKALMTNEEEGVVYDVTKVLAMHPLIGRETRPFEYHSPSVIGCTSCHGGNGRGLTTDKAHGPVFDGQYEKDHVANHAKFTEADEANDPLFARAYNGEPGEEIKFQTTPILIGPVLQAKCMQCHQTSAGTLEGAAWTANTAAERRRKQTNAITAGIANDKQALIQLLELRKGIEKDGYDKTIALLKEKSQNYALPPQELEQADARLAYLQSAEQREGESSPGQPKAAQAAIAKIDGGLAEILGSKRLAEDLAKTFAPDFKDGGREALQKLNAFIEAHKDDRDAKGTIFVKLASWNLEKAVMQHIQDVDDSFEKTISDQKVISAMSSQIDLLTSHYQRGKELYRTQACYACHRIAGLARGGVGPELTAEGNKYPWYVKESIVWPQADLPSSIMPNFRMDHEELQDLVTFLLGQVGETKAVSETAYKTAIQDWEAGRKLPWEKPIPPAEILDLRYSMTVFATEGCAACHRLDGFESNVGFAVEKGRAGKVPFDTMYAEKKWFKSLFPESILGSELVKTVEEHEHEIDQHIVDGVRQGALLEEIESQFPNTIETYYTPFKFAGRAKDAHYQRLAGAEKDPQKKELILEEWQQWKERLRRILMVFIQEYGLGRLIGPRPNWSGVYRSDEWLMEHFHTPTSRVPRSIMPVFPFDDTKFYALTHMLDVLGIRNRNQARDVWDHEGFQPEKAYQIHCAQCHGEDREGNGPVAVWIYPIPKNLRNPDFLLNLTKERAIKSIAHGVKGTPMPPWGETPAKPASDGIPVLNHHEIVMLVDWLFSSLPAGTAIENLEGVSKWSYSPEDVIKELNEEGNTLQPEKPSSEKEGSAGGGNHSKTSGGSTLPPELASLPRGEGLWASLDPKDFFSADAGSKNTQVLKIFDMQPNPTPGPEKYGFYIKKKYYTEENIEQGKAFFEFNCASCHGSEADGAGLRAEVMHEAKPRMLTNLDWLNMHDDLYLLRSIKYGMPGTAMTPWGDLTSSLQRLQLVIFIRSLSENAELQEKLSTAMYNAFAKADYAIEQARALEYPALKEVQARYKEARSRRENIDDFNKAQGDPTKKMLELYQSERDSFYALSRREELDAQLLSLKQEVEKEKELYQPLGEQILSLNNPQLLDIYVEVLEVLDRRFKVEGGKLVLLNDEGENKKISVLGNQIIRNIDGLLASARERKNIEQGKIPSAEINERMAAMEGQIKTLMKLKNDLISAMDQADRIRFQEREIYEKYATMLERLKREERKDASPLRI